MAFTRDWDESNPTDSTVANEIDDYNRYLRVDVSDRIKDMVYGFTAGENDGNQGFKKATFRQQASAPSTPNADEIVIYALDDGSNCGMYAKNEDGYAKQFLKKSGTSLILNCAAGDYGANSIDEDDIRLNNNSYLTGRNNADDGDINLIKVNASDEAEVGEDGTTVVKLADGSKLASSAAPTADAELANKKYVDDQCDAHVGTAGQFHTASVNIVNNTSIGDTSWHEQDLSGTIGSNAALCIFRVVTTDNIVVSVRKEGVDDSSGVTPSAANIFNSGTTNTIGGYIMCPASSTGKVDYSSSNGSATITLQLVGYIK